MTHIKISFKVSVLVLGNKMRFNQAHQNKKHFFALSIRILCAVSILTGVLWVINASIAQNALAGALIGWSCHYSYGAFLHHTHLKSAQFGRWGCCVLGFCGAFLYLKPLMPFVLFLTFFSVYLWYLWLYARFISRNL